MSKFIEDRRGNFGTMLAVAILPLMICVGAAVDYTQFSHEKSTLQNAVDAATLAVGEKYRTMSQQQIDDAVLAYIKANVDDKTFQTVLAVMAVPNTDTHTLTVTASVKSPTSFMMLAGIDDISYSVEAQIKAPYGGAEIVMVLDNTGSMNLDGKLDALKVAATTFATELMVEPTGGDVKLGIVPFSNHVNVGMANRNASWISVEDDSSVTEPNVCRMKRDLISQSNCQTMTTVDNEGQPYDYQQCDNVYGTPYQVCRPRTTTEVWNGCVGSRTSPDTLTDKNWNNKVTGLMNVWCGAPVTPLTNSRQTITDQIDAMVANGDTYIPVGITWGLSVLSNEAPFTGGTEPALATAKNIRKIMVLMTDGENSRSSGLSYGSAANWGTDLTEANDWTSTACANVKDESISVYTITFGSIDNDTKAIIKGCASEDSQYFHAANNGQLKQIFKDIQSQISALHLSM